MMFFLFFIFFLFFFNFFLSFSVSTFFSFSFEEKTLPLFMGLGLDFISITFILMVSLVTCLVFFYSEVYMESYNNKKFFYLTLAFFSFMTILASGVSPMNSMIGWDGLGISSLLLIMFYPNKITFFNSFLTFFFNRVGDIFFLLFFTFFITNYSLFFFLSNYDTLNLLFFFLLCLMTKSAQFPFSSWLPAAMSAPTPISAMVHSSTLVTAGIFLLFKFFDFFHSLGLISFLLLFSCSTFLLGGLLGVVEGDLKKIVAFSTMSQISMILFFISSGLLNLGLLHTLGHALFKTLLFCSCGLIFIWNFSDQVFKNLSSKNFNFGLLFFFLVSIYSMSGLPFSISFYTKDLVMEFFLQSKNFYIFIALIFGSFLTIVYSGKIFKSSSFLPSLKSSYIFKESNFFFIFFFSFFTIFLFKSIFVQSGMSLICLVSSTEVLFLNLMVFSFFLYKLDLKFFHFLSVDILFLKNLSFGVFHKFYRLIPSVGFVNDVLFFKPYIVDFHMFSKETKFMMNSWVYFVLLFFLYFLH